MRVRKVDLWWFSFVVLGLLIAGCVERAGELQLGSLSLGFAIGVWSCICVGAIVRAAMRR